MQTELITDTISGTAMNESFSLELLESISVEPCKFYQPDYNLILFVTDGCAIAVIDGENVEIYKNNIVLISKGEVFAIQSIAKGYILKFGNCFWDKTPISASNCKAALFDSGQTNRKFDLDEVHKNDLYSLFEVVLNDYQGPFYSNKADAIAAYLKIIIIKIANIHSLLQLNTELYDTKLYQRFAILVQQDFKRDHNVSTYAKKLGVSSRKLNDVCKAAGTGAKEIIISEIISEAKRLLQFTSLSIKEISATLSFSTPYHFSNFFKKYTGLSPVNYKLKYAQKGI